MNTAGNIATANFEPSRGTMERASQTPNLFILEGSTEFRWQFAAQEEVFWVPDNFTEIQKCDSDIIEHDPAERQSPK